MDSCYKCERGCVIPLPRKRDKMRITLPRRLRLELATRARNGAIACFYWISQSRQSVHTCGVSTPARPEPHLSHAAVGYVALPTAAKLSLVRRLS
jgi:hypothetical protein